MHKIMGFLANHGQTAGAVDAEASLLLLQKDIRNGLAGKSILPMIPSYLRADLRAEPNSSCAVIDAGGTHLRTALAAFDADGRCTLSDMQKRPMPGLGLDLPHRELYAKIAESVPCSDRVGFCFSYNVEMERTLDGRLEAWSKEMRSKDSIGKYVGKSLAEAMPVKPKRVVVLDDTTAAYLGGLSEARMAGCGTVLGLVLGTGLNICYAEQCARMEKLPADLRSGSMLINTETGEFDGFPLGRFDREVIDETDEPHMAHAEKQCSGAYLGKLIRKAWEAAAEEGLLTLTTAPSDGLSEISALLDGAAQEAFAADSLPAARKIAEELIARAAKITAILTAGFAIESYDNSGRPIGIIAEGSTFWKLSGFLPAYRRELDALLTPRGIEYHLFRQEDICLYGSALAAFAEPM